MKEYKVMKIDWDYKLDFVVTFCKDAGRIYND